MNLPVKEQDDELMVLKLETLELLVVFCCWNRLDQWRKLVTIKWKEAKKKELLVFLFHHTLTLRHYSTFPFANKLSFYSLLTKCNFTVHDLQPATPVPDSDFQFLSLLSFLLVHLLPNPFLLYPSFVPLRARFGLFADFSAIGCHVQSDCFSRSFLDSLAVAIQWMMPVEMGFLFVLLILGCLCSFVFPDTQGDALYALKSSLNASAHQLTDWNQNQVNPCTWSRVYCDSNNNVIQVSLAYMGFTGYLTPRIGVLKYATALIDVYYTCISSLQGNGITGSIPKEIGNMTSLCRLDLENNKLTGEIPSSLGNLKKLQFLTLSQNNLSGTIPESLATLPILINVMLDSNNLNGKIPERLFEVSKYNFTGNNLDCGHRLCESDNADQGSSHKSKTGLVVGIVIALVVILFLGGLLFFWCKGRDKGYRREVYVDVPGEVDRRIAFGQLKRFAWRELQIATDNFSEKNVLGQGGFGKVYKGVLADNTKVAVKRLTDYESPGGDAAFQREVEMISVAVHRNLLRLIGFCTTPTERLLVYPFMQNLSVAYRLRVVVFKNQPVIVALPKYYIITPLDMSNAVVKKLEREKRLDAIVDRNLNKNYNLLEVEMMIQVALLCTQATPEDRPPMSEVVRMLEGEGLAERWEEWQHVEVNRRQEYERLQRRFDWGEDSVYNQDAIELSGGR
ncbi:hypothetical protein V8G54_000755 [Vigna mungo]|uniref:Protein kinase domain-containing protein n=1 Tax=Vigna mungo TaxID=3915 RepID=A0AAQ3P559_VIGMU